MERPTQGVEKVILQRKMALRQQEALPRIFSTCSLSFSSISCISKEENSKETAAVDWFFDHSFSKPWHRERRGKLSCTLPITKKL